MVSSMELRKDLENKGFSCSGRDAFLSCDRASKQGTFLVMLFQDRNESSLSYHRKLSGRDFESKSREIHDLCDSKEMGRSPYREDAKCHCSPLGTELSYTCVENRDEGIPLARLGSIDLDLRLGLDRLRRRTKRLGDQISTLFG